MWIKILLLIAVVVVVLVIVVAMRPATFRITRTATMNAPPSVIFEQVNALRKWEAWSPWAKLDPAMKQTYDGPPAGAGASSHWVGNSEVGEGRMTIVETKPGEQVRLKLEFLKPFAATHGTIFTFEPQGGQTLVTWTMTGERNFMMKAMCLVMNMDKMVGGQFDQGLSQMKTIAEAESQIAKQPASL